MHRSFVLAVLLCVSALFPCRASAAGEPYAPPEYLRRLVFRSQFTVSAIEWMIDKPRLPAHQRCFAAAQAMMATDAVVHALALLPPAPKRDRTRGELKVLAERFQAAVKEDGRTSELMRLELQAACKGVAERLLELAQELEQR